MLSSGARGFFGEGYPYSALPPWSWTSFEGATFVAKTTTLKAREGNMPRTADGITPREFVPACIKVSVRRKFVLNAVGLSGPGTIALLQAQRWQRRKEPFFISVMAVSGTTHRRLQELKAFTGILNEYLPQFQAPVGLELNVSCPNVGVHHEYLAVEVSRMLDVAAWLEIPLVVNFNLNASVDLVARIAEHPDCDAVSVANSLPWGSYPELVNWEDLFGTTESPLAHLGGGGLSGAPILPVLLQWLANARYKIKKPLIAGGGITSPDDARQVIRVGSPNVRAVKVGTMVLLRPLRVGKTILAIRETLEPRHS